MPVRLSNYSKERKSGNLAFTPNLDKWRRVCGMCVNDTQMAKMFNVSRETFYQFLDRERIKEEDNEKYSSDYLAAYTDERYRTKEKIFNAYMEKINDGDTAAILFAVKTYLGHMEAKDVQAGQLKRQEVLLKTKEFLLQLADKFNLDFEQVKAFSKKHLVNPDEDVL